MIFHQNMTIIPGSSWLKCKWCTLVFICLAMIEFSNAQELQRQYPETFQVPDKTALSRIMPGDIVKVSALNERFWTKVITIENGIITASMENDLSIEELQFGDIIIFNTDSIYDIRR